MTADHAIELATEFLRIASVLRLHPENPTAAFKNPELQIPVFMALIRQQDPDSRLPAFVEEHEVKSGQANFSSISKIKLTIIFRK
jgi:hypothetical protein